MLNSVPATCFKKVGTGQQKTEKAVEKHCIKYQHDEVIITYFRVHTIYPSVCVSHSFEKLSLTSAYM